MQNRIVLLAGIFLTTAAAAQTTQWTQSIDNLTVTPGLSASCLDPQAGITDNSYWRLYDRSDPAPPNGTPAVAGDFEILSVSYGVESSTTSTGARTVRISVYEDPDGGAPGPVASLVLIGSQEFTLADTALSVETATFGPPIFVSSAVDFVAVEIMVFDGQPQGDFFFIGANSAGELPADSTYASAVACGTPDPVPFSSLGFPDVHGIIEFVTQPALPQDIGQSFCSPAIPNSTGLPAVMSATGSTSVSANDVTLRVEQVPPAQFGFFLVSRSQGLANPPGSNGFICLAADIGRYNKPGEVFTGPVATLVIDLGTLPTNTPGSQQTVPGEQLNFQAWYRDLGASNNFSDGLAVGFD